MDASPETTEHNAYGDAVARLESCRRRYDEYLALMHQQREAIGRGERAQLHSARDAMDKISSQLHAEMAGMESIRRYIGGATFDPERRTRLRRLVCEVAVMAEAAQKGVADLNQVLAGGRAAPHREGDEVVVAA